MLFFRDQFVCFQMELEVLLWSQVTIDTSWNTPRTDFDDFRFFDTNQSLKVDALRSIDQNQAKSMIFLTCELNVEGKIVATASGVWKILKLPGG